MNELQVIQNISAAPRMTNVNTDAALYTMWLNGLSAASKRTYTAGLEEFREYTDKPLNQITVEDLQGYENELQDKGLRPASIAIRIAAVKSLLSYGQKIGYLQYNVGTALRTVKVQDELSERILSQEDVLKIIALESNQRDHAILAFLYDTGLRVSELCGLRWKHFHTDGGKTVMTVHGKGGKTRYIPLTKKQYDMLRAQAKDTSPESPVFFSQKGGPLDVSAVRRIVYAAAAKAGVPHVSPHWFRHAHATHALKKGCPINIVQATLGHSSLQVTSRYTHIDSSEGSSLYFD